MLRRIHLVVGELMYARNFTSRLYDGERDSVRFIYFADAKDTNIYETDREGAGGEAARQPDPGPDPPGEPVRGPAHEVARALRIGSGIGRHVPALDFSACRSSAKAARRGGGETYEPGACTTARTAPAGLWRKHIMTALERKKLQAELERRVVIAPASWRRGRRTARAGQVARTGRAAG